MFSHYVKAALRGFGRYPVRTGINVLGLALGLACCLLIAMFVRDELSYDEYHEKAERIYRVVTELVDDDGTTSDRLASTFVSLGPAVESSVPGVEGVVRFQGSFLSKTLVTAGDTQHYEDRIFAADADVFDIFDFDLISGDPESALERPYTIVVSESTAARYFGDTDPIGKTVSIRSDDYEVTGVMRDVPHNTHLYADMLLSFATYAGSDIFRDHGWRLLGFYTYLLLEPDVSRERVRAGITEVAALNRPENPPRFELQRLTDIHLYSHLSGEIEDNSDIRYVRIFGLVSVLVLLVACVNYMNLASAHAMGRALEVGIRKATGARRDQIVAQFLVRSVATSLSAAILAAGIIELVLPGFNALTQKSLVMQLRTEGVAIGIVALAAGLFAGSYPAAVLSRFNPVRVLHGSLIGTGNSAGMLRRALVIFQFTTSIALITATIIVQRQIDYVSEDRLGFDKERLVSIHATEPLEGKYSAFKEELLAHSDITAVTTTTNVPGQVQYNHYGVRPRGKAGDASGEKFYMLYTNVDFDFVETMGLVLHAGRDFSPEVGTDGDDAILVNESAARKMGWEEPLEKQLFGRTVVGLVSDYLSTYSKSEVDPAAFIPTSDAARYVVVRMAPGWSRETIDYLSDTWHEFIPSAPLDYSFVDADIEALYRSEQRLARVFITFSLLAVFIACLGLFGLAAFSVQRRTREIGIRKVLGASAASIMVLLSREYIALVAISLLAGGTIAWFTMQEWLSDYAYRIELSPAIPVAAGVIALVIALGTVSVHAVRAVLSNPVDSLRME